MKLAYLLCAEAVAQDQAAKNSYLNIFDLVNVRELPTAIASFFICGKLLEVPTETLAVKVSVCDEAGTVVKESPVIDGAVQRAKDLFLNIRLENIIFSQVGRYYLKIEAGEDKNNLEEVCTERKYYIDVSHS